jgi:hypothetical protein
MKNQKNDIFSQMKKSIEEYFKKLEDDIKIIL